MKTPIIKFKVGQTFKARPNGHVVPVKIHIMYVLPSIYEDRSLVVYRWYGKHKQWWHEEMESDYMVSAYISHAKGN